MPRAERASGAEMEPRNVASRLRAGVAARGGLRWAATDVTAVTEEARRRLDLSPLAAAALGRALGGAAMLLRVAPRVPARLVLELRGDGVLGTVLAEADDRGNLRGTVTRPQAEIPHGAGGKLPVGRGIGSGFLRVIREQEDGCYRSEVALVSGEVAEDLAHYLAQSEQIRSAVLLGVLARPGGVSAAGGLIVEAMPDADPETLGRLEDNLARLGAVSRHLEEVGLRGVIRRAMDGLEWEMLESRPLRYRCRCSRERLQRHLRLLGREEISALRASDEKLEAECLFCGVRYIFDPAELVETVH